MTKPHTCPLCKGTGESLTDDICYPCNGTGILWEPQHKENQKTDFSPVDKNNPIIFPSIPVIPYVPYTPPWPMAPPSPWISYTISRTDSGTRTLLQEERIDDIVKELEKWQL